MVPLLFCWLIGIGLALWLVLISHRCPRPTPYALCAFFFVIGGAHSALVLHPPPSATDIHHLAQERREVALIGVLSRSPAIGPERTTLLVEAREIIERTGAKAQASGLIQLTMAAPPPSYLLPGDLLIARATIGPVISFGVPGAFNYQEYLAFQGIRASGFLRDPALLQKITRLGSAPWPEQLRTRPEAIRYRLSRFIAATLPPETAGVYQALLLGEQANLSPRVQEDFKASGSFHILSISGLHMALVSLCVTMLLSWLLRRSEWVLLHLPATKVAALLSLLPLTAYALIAGFNPPVVRSLIMVTVFIMALLVDRQWSIANNIAIAALLLLGANPALLFTASFQLTFVAVASIALFAPMVAKIIDHTPDSEPQPARKAWLWLKKWALASLLVSVAASLGTAPILAYHFHRLSLVSPLSTLLIEPFFCLWALILGLLACLLVGLPSLAGLLFSLGAKGITIGLGLATLCAGLPWSFIWLPTPSIPAIAAWYGLMFLVACHAKLSRRQAILWGLACLGLALSPHLIPGKAGHETRLTVLDVGQGSAMIIELPNQDAILVDGGRKQAPSASGFDVGEDLIAPFLWHRGIRRLAAVVCTHPDADHYNGIPFILRHFRPETLWVNSHDSEEGGYRQLLALAAQLQVDTRVPAAGMALVQDAGASLTALTGGQPVSPDAHPDGKKSKNRNNQSLVLRLTHGQTTFLLPSDIEQETEQDLLTRMPLKSDVLVAPHHGSATSSSEDFAKAVAPRQVAISAGKNQDGHFPDPATVARYQALGSVILNTAEHGSLTYRTDGKALRVETYR